jgi:sporulation protein YlmC with PRC-barrel domain
MGFALASDERFGLKSRQNHWGHRAGPNSSTLALQSPIGWHGVACQESEREKAMKKYDVVMSLVVFLALSLSTTAFAQQQGQSQQESAADPNASQDTAKSSPLAQTTSTLRGVLVSSDTILGVSVKNQQGEAIGSIQHLLIDPKTGSVSYAELKVGGLLGMGEKTIIIPWRSLEISRDGDALVIKTPKPPLQPATEPKTEQKS